MKIEYVHASKFGNGAAVAAEFANMMRARGATVQVHHVREVMKATGLPEADLYVFSSPGRFGKPIRRMRRFLTKVQLPAAGRYAILTTEMPPQPDKTTGELPSEAEQARWQRVRPIMHEILQGKGLIPVAEGTVYVTGLRGPLEDGWQEKVETFAATLATAAAP